MQGHLQEEDVSKNKLKVLLVYGFLFFFFHKKALFGNFYLTFDEEKKSLK